MKAVIPDIKKPDARIFQRTLEELGCEAAECIYVDDRRFHLAAAQAVGMDAVLFNSRDVLYDGKTAKGFPELEEMLFGGGGTC